MNIVISSGNGFKQLFRRALLAFFCIFFVLPINAMANGAVSRSGYYGTELTIAENKPFENFVIDENVIIDLRNNTVSVVYEVDNASEKEESFTMLFPYESYGCAEDKEYDEGYEDVIKFSVLSNGVGLPIKFISSDTVKLEGEYKKLEIEVCSFVSFDVTIKPGKNTLKIHYSIRPQHFVGDGVGVRDYQRYSIWPAKNWVSRFRKALWRVMLPDKQNLGLMDISGYNYLFDDWYSRVDCQYEDEDCKNGIWSLYTNKLDIKVEGPGDRHEYPDYVDFIADNYPPTGKIDIRIDFIDLHFKVLESCKYNDIDDDCSKKFINIHPYFGDKACYDVKDIETYPNYMDFVYEPKAIKYLRNEIFARLGYNFKAKEFSNYFADMSWYSPKYDRVILSDVEKWNVEFLERVEKSSKNYTFDGEHCELDCEEGFIYEIREKMWHCPTIDPRIKARALNAN